MYTGKLEANVMQRWEEENAFLRLLLVDTNTPIWYVAIDNGFTSVTSAVEYYALEALWQEKQGEGREEQ